MADNIRLELDVDKVLRRMSTRAKRAMPRLCSVIRADCNKYVRVDRGGLRASSFTASQLDAGLIVWHTIYAKRVYYTGHPSKDVNPSASLRWAEVAKANHMKKWERLAQKEMTE